MEHAFRFLSFSNKGSRELSVETTASLLEKPERFKRGGACQVAMWASKGPTRGASQEGKEGRKPLAVRMEAIADQAVPARRVPAKA